VNPPQLAAPAAGRLRRPWIATSVAALDATQQTTKFGLPGGETAGYGGYLDDMARRALKAETGREADPAGTDYWRTRLARGTTDEAARAEMNASQEGQDYNLVTDPLDDAGFARRAYKAMLGREPDAAGAQWLTGMLSQGADRQAVLDAIKNSAEFNASGKKWDQALADKILQQGDSFKEADLKGADLEKYNATKQKIAAAFKAEMGRDPTANELARYADMVRSGKLNIDPSTTTTNLSRDQLIDGFYKAMFGDNYRPNDDDRAQLGNMLANAPVGMPEDDILRQYAGMRRLGEDFRAYGRNTSDEELLAAIQGLRSSTTSSPLIDMLRARKTAGFADGGRVKKPMKKRTAAVGLPPAHHLPPEDGGMALADGGRVEEGSMKKVNGKMVPSQPGDPKVRTSKDGYSGVRGRKDDAPDIFADEVLSLADGGQISIDPQTNRLMLDGRVLERNDPRLHGDLGYVLRGTKAGMDPIYSSDPRFFTRTGSVNMGGGDSGEQMQDVYGIRPELASELEGWVQLPQSGIGGFAEGQSRNPADYKYVPGLGILTRRENVGAMDPHNAGNWQFGALTAAGLGVTALPAIFGAGADAAGAVGSAGNESAGLLMDNPFAAAAPGAIDESAGLLTNNPFAAGTPPGQGVPDIFADSGYIPAGEGDVSAVNAGLQGDPFAGTQPFDLSTIDTQALMQAAAEGTIPSGLSQPQLLAWLQANPSAVARLGLGAASLFGGSHAGAPGGNPVARTPYVPGAGNTGVPATGQPGQPAPGGSAVDPSRPAAGFSAPAAAAPPAPAAAAAPASIYAGGFGTSSIGGGSMGRAPGKPGQVTDAIDPINTLLSMGNEQLSKYRDYAPLERQIRDEAMRAGGDADQQQAADLAAAAVADRVGASKRALSRRMDPTRAAALGVQMDVAGDGASALAQNDARRGAKDGGFSKRIAAYGIGRGDLDTGLSAVQNSVSGLLGKEGLENSREASRNSLSASMASLSQRATEAAAADARARNDLLERQREYDATSGENRRQFDTRLGEDSRRYDQNYGRGVLESDRNYGENQRRYNQGFDFDVWRANQGMSERQDDRDYTRNRNYWTDIGTGVRTGLDIYDRVPWSTIFAADGGRVSGRVRTRGITRFGDGGRTAGEGDGTYDTIPAMLADGEVVLNKPAVELADKIAPQFLDKLNDYGERVNKMRRSRAAAAGLPERR
jgi:hypothetical protein